MNYNTEGHNNLIVNIQSTVFMARAVLKKNDCNTIVVVDSNKFLGIIDKEELFKVDENSTLNDVRYLLKPVYLREDYTLFDWLKLTFAYNTSSIPVVDDDNEMTFLELIDKEDIFKKFENTGLHVENSIVLIIKKPTKTFLYSEVFQIAESNAAKIFGSYINRSNEDETEIVLNIYHMGLNELLQSYRRYDYDIISFHVEDLHQETLKANSEYFSKYLTV